MGIFKALREKEKKMSPRMRRLLGVIGIIAGIIGLGMGLWDVFRVFYSGPVETAKRMVFEGTTKPIGDLLASHPQVRKVEWSEMPVLGEGVVVARVTFGPQDKREEYTLLITMKVVKNSGMLMSVEYIPLPEERDLFAVERPTYPISFFLRRLENKEDLHILTLLEYLY